MMMLRWSNIQAFAAGKLDSITKLISTHCMEQAVQRFDVNTSAAQYQKNVVNC